MSDEDVTTLRPWRNRDGGGLIATREVNTQTQVVKETLPEGYDARMAALEARMTALEDAQQSMMIRTDEIERRPHLTADDVSNLGNAADARAKRAIESEIMPMIENLRAQVNATQSMPVTEQPKAVRTTEQLSDVIEKMIPVVKGLEQEGQRLGDAQKHTQAELAAIRRSMEQLHTDQLEMVIASVRDQRKLISQQAATLAVGNDG